MKKLPLGIQCFREIVTCNYFYIDKTKYIYKLINGAKYFFLSRPRRFGKSLLLDTISEVFSGDRELFKGFWIYGSDYNFPKHPVIRLDMSNISNNSPSVLEASLFDDLRIKAESEGGLKRKAKGSILQIKTLPMSLSALSWVYIKSTDDRSPC